MGDESTSVVTLAIGQAIINTKIDNITRDVDVKHIQNRKDVHELRDDVQTLTNEVYLMKVKITTYSSVAGVLTGILIKIVDHFWK